MDSNRITLTSTPQPGSVMESQSQGQVPMSQGQGSQGVGDVEVNLNGSHNSAMSSKSFDEGDSNSSTQSARDVVIKMLDEIDQRVEKLRTGAITLENEKDDILSSLDTLGNSQMVHSLGGIDTDEVTRYIERLAKRSMAVQIDVRTERSSTQLDALSKINNLIDGLIRDFKADACSTRRRCVAYINACSEKISGEIPDIDSKFESVVLECSIEDQKRIRKRLAGLHSYFKTAANSMTVDEEDEEEFQVNEAIEQSLSQNLNHSQ